MVAGVDGMSQVVALHLLRSLTGREKYLQHTRLTAQPGPTNNYKLTDRKQIFLS